MSESISKQIIEMYCNHGILTNEFDIDTTPKTILKELTRTKVKYTWETVREEKVDETSRVIEVRVYLPGHILFGRHVYDVADIEYAHLYAISNAIKIIVHEKENPEIIKEEIQQPVPVPTSVDTVPTPQPQIETKQQTQALSQEEILGMIQQTNTKITTAEQLNNDPREELPFEDIDLSPNELDNLFQGMNNQQTTPQVHKYTQEQINAINQIKAKFNITTDEQLGSLVNSWNIKYTSKKDLTPNNIDSFISWANNLGKSPC